MNIAAARRRRGMTQLQLAEKAGLNKSTVSHYERKAQAIPLANIQRIAEILNVSVDYLLNGKADRNDLSASKPLLKRLEKAKDLTPEKQKLIVDLIDSLTSA